MSTGVPAEARSPVRGDVIGHVYRDLDGDGKVDNCGRLCDFDVLGWTGWPMAWNLWNAAMPWHELVYKKEGSDAKGFHASPPDLLNFESIKTK